MKRLVIILTFLISQSLFASEVLVYSLSPSQKESLKRLDIKYTSIFTQKEIKLLKDENVNTNIIKIQSKSFIKTKELISSICKDCIVERNHSGSLYNSNDPYLEYQWALENKGLPLDNWTSDIEANQIPAVVGEDIQGQYPEKDKNIKVAIIDSGIDINHPDLKNKIYKNDKECKALDEYNACLNKTTDKNICYEKFKDFDANGNGYPLDCHGWSITDKSNPLSGLEGNGNINDLVGHGTHVAGIIGAEKNSIGVQGVISHVELIPIQVSLGSQNRDQSELATDKFAKALLYAIKSKVDVVNMSLGWRFDQDSLLMREMIELALKNKIIVVAAAGNDAHSKATYPCSYEEVICVGAHSVDGKISTFSNYGAHIDLLAPGTKILSTWPTNKRSRSFTIDSNYEYMSGTSQAAPFVTGAVARLLNLGFSPQETKIKLLNGARTKEINDKNFSRYGNLDIKRSIISKPKSFIYPLNKAPSLINWNKKEKSFLYKIKNYGEKVLNTDIQVEVFSNSNIKLTTKNFSIKSIDTNEIKDIRIKFESPDYIHSEFLFKVSIQNSDEKKSFILEANAISVITPDFSRIDSEEIQLTGNTIFLENSTIRPFKNFTQESDDYLALKLIDNKTHIALVRTHGNTKNVTESLPLPFKNPVIINMSKVDLELDGKADYVLTVVNIESQDKRETKFLALDENFKPKRIEIAPKNTFKNDLTVLPGGFIWLKYNMRMVPAWISVGERPISERETSTLWEDTPIEFKSNHFYLQLPEGLKTIRFPAEKEIPLHFLYQSTKNKNEGKVILISSEGLGFVKKYHLYEFSGELDYLKPLLLNKYFDLASARPLPLVNKHGSDNAFFNTQSVGGAHNIFKINYDSNLKKIDIIQDKVQPKDKSKSIQFVLSVNNKASISQTATSLVLNNGNTTSSLTSNTDAKRIKHGLLSSRLGLFLSSAYTPGLNSEIITLNEDSELIKPSHLQFVSTNGCFETGLISENQKDKVQFVCPESKKLFQIDI